MNEEWLAQLAGLIALALVLVALQMGQVKMPGGKVAGYSSALVAIELSKSADLAKTVLGSAETVERARANLDMDRFFLVVYTLLYATLGALLAQRPGRWYLALGIAAAVLAFVAAVFDISENRHALEVLKLSPGDTTTIQAAMEAAFLPSVLKWTAISASAILLSLLFFGGSLLAAIPGALLLISGLVGLSTAFYPPVAQWVILLQAVPLLAILSWLFRPEWLFHIWR